MQPKEAVLSYDTADGNVHAYRSKLLGPYQQGKRGRIDELLTGDTDILVKYLHWERFPADGKEGYRIRPW